MKIAILLQCHKIPEQVNMFLETMYDSVFTFFIHIDKKSSIGESLLKRNDIIILPDYLRVDVQWGNISQVDATLNLMNYTKGYGEFDYYWLCSGQDFPIKPIKEIVSWFEEYSGYDFVELFQSKNYGLNYSCNYDKRNEIIYPKWMLGNKKWKRVIKRLYVELTGGYKKTFKCFKRKNILHMDFYFGSSWICFSKCTFEWIMDYLKNHKEYYDFFTKCNCPDESFFQTLLMNSPYKTNRKDYLHYVDWSEGKNNPKVLTEKDYDSLKISKYLMARKFDILQERKVIDMILNDIEEKYK